MRGLLIRVGIIGGIALGAFIVRPFISSNAGELAVGDCFDEPEQVTTTVKDVQHHPCTDLHDAEVFYVGKFEPATTTFPSDAEFVSFIRDRCTGAFNTYTGLDFNTAQDLDYSAFYPTSEGWSDGDRQITCYVVKVDQSQFNASMKKAS